MPEVLFYDSPYARRCDAVVLSAATGGTKTKPRTQVVLDRTIFYPAGGGQPGDRGILRQEGAEYIVRDTVKGDDGTPVHVLEGASRPTVGAVVSLEIDWNHRFDYMQQHSGQHLLSAALYRIADANTVSVHQGERYTTIEVDRDSILPAQLSDVETAAREVILENRPITSFPVSSDDLVRFPLRRPTSRTGEVRLVEIDNWDRVACAGVHVRSTAQIGNVQTVGSESLRGNLRLVFAIGNRAHRDYGKVRAAALAAAGMFSASIEDLPDRVHQALDEIRTLHGRTKSLARRLAKRTLESGRFAPDRPALLELGNEEDALFDALVRELAEQGFAAACVVNRGSDKVRFAIIAHGGNGLPVQKTVQGVIRDAGARGGGREPLWQGICDDADRLARCFSAAFPTKRQT